MRQTMVRRLVMVGSLAMILSVARPGAVQARELRAPGAWGWLQQLWTQGISALWSGPALVLGSVLALRCTPHRSTRKTGHWKNARARHPSGGNCS